VAVDGSEVSEVVVAEDQAFFEQADLGGGGEFGFGLGKAASIRETDPVAENPADRIEIGVSRHAAPLRALRFLGPASGYELEHASLVGRGVDLAPQVLRCKRSVLLAELLAFKPTIRNSILEKLSLLRGQFAHDSSLPRRAQP
jgi:hypothetical protein